MIESCKLAFERARREIRTPSGFDGPAQVKEVDLVEPSEDP